jgi:uncharacterized protein YceK
MKKLLLVTVLSLSGCATINDAIDAYLMKYDNNEYKLITEVRTKAGSAKNNCADTMESKRISKELLYTSTFLMHYAEHLPHNKPIQQATVELNDMVKGLSDKYDSGSVSPVFCKIKFTSIEESANKMQQSEGKKPK